jgi:hypothetical protein
MRQQQPLGIAAPRGIGEISRFQGAGFNPVSIGCGGFTDPSRVM